MFDDMIQLGSSLYGHITTIQSIAKSVSLLNFEAQSIDVKRMKALHSSQALANQKIRL
jgi:hypothetical protein